MCMGIDLWVYPVWSLFSFLNLQVCFVKFEKFSTQSLENVFPAHLFCPCLCWENSVYLCSLKCPLSLCSWLIRAEGMVKNLLVLLAGVFFVDSGAAYWDLAWKVLQCPLKVFGQEQINFSPKEEGYPRPFSACAK